MLRKLLLVLSFVIAGSILTYAQTGSLKVKLIDKVNNEPIPFANVLIEQNGARVAVSQTNMDGEIMFTALSPGKYDIKASYVGYQTMQQTGVIVSSDKTTYPKLAMSSGDVKLNVVEVTEYSAPLITADVTSGSTVTRDQFINMAQKDVNTIVAQTAGVFQSDQGGAISIRGSRGDAVAYFVDGVRVVGGLGVPQLGVEQITTVTGGIPAQYGDATGGIISITTRGVQPNFFASVQGESSQYLDAFGHNLLGFSFGAPIYSIRDTAGYKKNVVGFIVSGDFNYSKDPSPSAIGTYKVKDDVLHDLEQNPLRPSPTGNLRNSEFITMNDLEKIKYRQNVAQSGINIAGKLQFKLSENTDLSLGGRYYYNNSRDYIFDYALFNSANNPQQLQNTYSLNARLVQRFNTKTETEKEKSNSVITNAVYTLQVEYTNNKYVTQNANHGDNYFDYGYIGKFDRIKGKAKNYDANFGGYFNNFEFDSKKNAFVQQAPFGDSIIRFSPSNTNQIESNYTSQFFSFNNENVQSFNQIQAGLGLLNGDRPGNVYSLWYNTGRQYPGYAARNDDVFRVSTNFAASIKNHNIQVGFEYEQRIFRQFNVNAADLWTLMRQLSNTHLEQMDTANPITVTGGGTFDYIYYNQKYDAAKQGQFDKNLREKLGMPVNGTNIINTDGYDPGTYSLSMFSPDELLTNNGNPYVTAYGYDYSGKKLSKTPSFDAFFNDKDANGNFKRQMGAVQPIYISGYIQDQFDIQDLKFRLGLRVDRYDANTKVLKDKYSLYELKTVGEVNNLGSHPSNIGNDYIIYVDDALNPSKITGYRNEDKWYTPQGVEVNRPQILADNAHISKIAPYLLDPNSKAISSKAFKDYVPQLNLMPRIAFAFPISDLAQFNANYDITTQRPTYGTNLALPTDYLFWPSQQSPFFGNAALQPQRTTSYEIGFTQVLNERKNSALTLSAFYKELRNLIQQRSMINAYPQQYATYDNIDFATVKGFSVGYDLRRTNNVQLKANYAIQFADGTGSGINSGFNLASSGDPTLRTLLPLTYDRRHTINIVMDYRFGEKGDYNGPVVIRHKGEENEKVIKLLEDVGFNLAMQAGSGTPFSRQSNVTQDVATGISQKTALSGSINGSNLPWSYRMDLKVDKNLKVTWRAERDGKAAKVGHINIYIVCLNLLDTKNVVNVYHYTGSPTDDGYLTSAEGIKATAASNSPAAYNDLYSAKVNNNLGFYSIPRSIRIGFRMDFQ